MIVVSKCMLIVFRPSLEVVEEGRISDKIQTLTRPIVGVFLGGQICLNLNKGQW